MKIIVIAAALDVSTASHAQQPTTNYLGEATNSTWYQTWHHVQSLTPADAKKVVIVRFDSEAPQSPVKITPVSLKSNINQVASKPPMAVPAAAHVEPVRTAVRKPYVVTPVHIVATTPTK